VWTQGYGTSCCTSNGDSNKHKRYD